MPIRDYLLDPSSLKTQGASSPVVRTQGFAPEVLKLAGQLTRERAKAGIGVPKAPDPGVMGRIFDIIQRPLYASANTVDYAVKGKNPLEGTLRGVTGQDKTSYDKVLEDMGMSGGWQRSLLGFAGDIGLDPTTYVGLGIEKNLAEGVAKRVAVEGAADAIEKEAGKGVVKNLTKDIIDSSKVTTNVETAASKAARAQHLVGVSAADEGQASAYFANKIAASPGESIEKITNEAYQGMPEKVYKTTQKGTRQATREAEEIARGNAMSSILDAKDKALAEQRGKVYLKFMGKQTPIASEGLYRLGSKAGEAVRDLPVISSFNAAFRPSYNLPQGLNTLVRNAESHGIFKGEEAIRDLVRNVGPHQLDGGEFEKIMKSISRGEPVEGVAAKTGKPLQDYADYLKTHVTNRTAEAEVDLGIRAPKNLKENYVPMILRGGSDQEKAAFKKGYRAGLPGYTLDDAINKGLDPMMTPEAYGNHIIKSQKVQVPARINRAAETEFGIHLDQLAPGKTSNRVGRQLAKDLDLKSYKLPGFTENVYFPPEIGDALKHAHKIVTDPAAGGELLKHYDKVQNAWKLSMTAVNPGHHIRNFAGDVWLNFMDGVKNPARYSDAGRVLRNWRDNPNAFKMVLGGKEYNAGELMDLFTHNGGKSGFFRQEFGESAKSAGGRLMHPIETIRQAAEMREDWTRMAHFLDVMEKGGVKGSHADIQALAKEAGQRIRKFNIDYGDLTPFEKNFMKRVVPFYTWMRKNIPLQLETLAMDPGKINVVPKGLRALQNVTGAEPDTANVMGLNVIPQWLREMGGVRIAGEGVGRNQMFWNPNIIPSTDIGQYFNAQNPLDVLRQFGSSVSPVIRMPIEQATGRMLVSGAPVGETSNYLGQQIIPPSVPALKALLTGKGEAPDIGKLLGVSLYNVGPQQQLGELRRQQDAVTALLKAKKSQKARSWEPGYAQAG